MPIPDIVDGNPQIDTQWWMKARCLFRSATPLLVL